ncbi:MAG: tRNA (adenosine(37)-N6)-methyltransferase TrmM, partial [Saprospiraceae bacterium]
NNTNSFEHIVSNPPFFEAGSLPTEKERLDARHTASLSLEELINGCEKLLPLQGRCSFILPPEQAEKLIELGIKKDLNLSRITYVQPLEHKKVERVLLELTKGIKKTIGPQKLIIQHKGRNNWTDAYISLTKDFYLKM